MKTNDNTEDDLAQIDDAFDEYERAEKAYAETPDYIVEHADRSSSVHQGFPISGVFANVYLIEFDQMLQQICRQLGGFYRGYSDDFITKYSFKSCR